MAAERVGAQAPPERGEDKVMRHMLVASCEVNSHSPTTRASLVRGGEDKSIILLGFLHIKENIRSGEEQGHFEKEIV